MDNLNILFDYDLQPLNTLGVPARAMQYVRATNEATLMQALAWAQQQGLRVLVLGGGSNVVLPEAFDGLVIQVAIIGIEMVAEDDEYACVQAGAGETWQDLVEFSMRQNLFGLENLSLIPGTVGAAPIQNIGAYGVELESVFETLTAADRATLQERVFNRTECEFRYRDSIFKNRLRDALVITRVTLRLRKRASLNISYAPLQEALADVPVAQLTPRQVSDAVIAIRRSKLPDPRDLPNAGSFFKNPVVSREKFLALKRDFPDIASYPMEDGSVKLAAGWLLEKSGWRGHLESGIGMHAKQALVLINPGRANGERVLDYARHIQQDVQRRFDVMLEREPVAYTGDA